MLEHAGHGFLHDQANLDFLPTFEALLQAGAHIRGNWLHRISQLKTRSDDDKLRTIELFRKHGATT